MIAGLLALVTVLLVILISVIVGNKVVEGDKKLLARLYRASEASPALAREVARDIVVSKFYCLSSLYRPVCSLFWSMSNVPNDVILNVIRGAVEDRGTSTILVARDFEKQGKLPIETF